VDEILESADNLLQTVKRILEFHRPALIDELGRDLTLELENRSSRLEEALLNWEDDEGVY